MSTSLSLGEGQPIDPCYNPSDHRAMTTPTPTDPMAMFRDVVNQWEKLANEYGGQLLARPEAAQLMQGATSAGLQIQSGIQDAMAKVLTAANMPSKADIEALTGRLAAVEASLARIEATLATGDRASSTPNVPRPTRGRKPTAPA